MFRRKKKDRGDSESPASDAMSELDEEKAAQRRTAQESHSLYSFGPTQTESVRRMAEPSHPTVSAPRRISSPTPVVREQEGKKLTVGKDIALAGEVSACDILEVFGRVEISLLGAKILDVAEGGYFKGDTELETATISGHYEGNLTVRGTVSLRATGKISGSLRYRKIEIELGGEVNGTLQTLSDSSPQTPPLPSRVP